MRARVFDLGRDKRDTRMTLWTKWQLSFEYIYYRIVVKYVNLFILMK